MGESTHIAWTDATLNLWWGCTKVSDGCKNCYAEELSDQRYKKGAWGPKGTRVEIKPWRATLKKISDRGIAENRRLKVFCQSMSDVFEGPETMGGEDSDNWKLVSRLQGELFEAITLHSHLDFQVLTKRPENVLNVVHRHDDPDWLRGAQWAWPENLWLGTSVEDEKSARKRIPYLLRCPAAVRFLSCEPLIGDIDITEWLWGRPIPCHNCPKDADCECGWQTTKSNGEPSIDWVIVGGESGPNYRPMDLAWLKSIVEQCRAAEVPVFVKQDSGSRSGQQGRIPDDIWALKQFPEVKR